MSKKLILVSWVLCALTTHAVAQTFPGFSPGNIIVSRTVYMGSPATLGDGQALPPVCPAATGAKCGSAVATDNGAYPSTSYANNVFKNNLVDGSFGITSPIFLDQMTPAGNLVNILPIPTTMVSTSFPSKSELALNVSTDGSAITFMAYVAQPNAVDVSNSNTPGAYDPTNPSGTSYYRAVVQVGANGAIMVTPTNSYSGNNGRAAAMSNGIYYMAGNSNNGGGTPTNIINTAGAQLAIAGQAFATPAVQLGSLSISQVTNPATGLPYPPDKAGKDNNFRGLTIFGNTLYMTKGSGGNGINTVYRVGDKGSLPTPANAASAAITVVPGFPTALASATGAANPFGLYFANATTLYVADEGDGTTANASTSTIAGLQKWVLNNGTWTRAYVMQNGLNLGKQYTIGNYPPALYPANDGLRNIAGKVNSDGTVTIWAVTSTISANGDQGADPNQLVMITDVLANTDPAVAAKQQFSIVRTANAGELFRGVSLTPTAGQAPMANVPLILSAANPGSFSIAPGSLATANGQGLATATSTQTVPYPTTVSGTSVSIVDGAGATTAAQIVSISPNQITFLVPSTVAPGIAQVSVTTGSSTQTANNVQISTVAPGILTINGVGTPAAQVVTPASDGSAPVTTLVYTTNSSGATVANPIAAAPGATLVLYGTGIAAAGTALTSATVNGLAATVTYAGPASKNSGLDQVNILIPAKAAGAGNALVQVIAEGVPANPVSILIQ